jgi:hypothetical protein
VIIKDVTVLCDKLRMHCHPDTRLRSTWQGLNRIQMALFWLFISILTPRIINSGRSCSAATGVSSSYPPTMSQVNQVFSSLHSAAHNVKAKLSSKKEESALRTRSKLFDHGPDGFVDLNIRFIGASGQSIHTLFVAMSYFLTLYRSSQDGCCGHSG